jgi:bifunctional DNA-binding transcriptional regulator/antitoxin component of YhaV-PrlF toxin-antitoxin module
MHAMEPIHTVRVSRRGQMSVPAAARHRWAIDEGGELGAIDLGTAVLLVPGGEAAARRALADALGEGRYRAAVEAIEDPALRDQ